MVAIRHEHVLFQNKNKRKKDDLKIPAPPREIIQKWASSAVKGLSRLWNISPVKIIIKRMFQAYYRAKAN